METDMKVTIQLDPESGYSVVTKRTATLGVYWQRRVEVSRDFKDRYNRVAREYNQLQREMHLMYQDAASSQGERSDAG
jgi:hypothetical protein